MASSGIHTRIADLSQVVYREIRVVIFRYQEYGEYTVLLLKHPTTNPIHGWWTIPTDRVRETDVTIAGAMRRIILENTCLELPGDHEIRQIKPISWRIGDVVNTQLNFVIRDTSTDMVEIDRNEFVDYQWVEEERLDSLSIPRGTKEIIRQGFRFCRLRPSVPYEM